MPDRGDRHQEYPDVRDQVRDVGEVDERNYDEAFGVHSKVPVCLEWPADEEKRNCNADSPGNDKCSGCADDLAKEWVDEDSPVEGEDAQFDKDQC